MIDAWLTNVVLITMLAIASGFRLRVSGGVNADLGWMSAKWLAEHRAAQGAR